MKWKLWIYSLFSKFLSSMNVQILTYVEAIYLSKGLYQLVLLYKSHIPNLGI